MRFKKAIALLLAFVIVAAAFSACGGGSQSSGGGSQSSDSSGGGSGSSGSSGGSSSSSDSGGDTATADETPEETVREPITVKMFGGAGAESSFSTEHEMGREIEELFGVTFEKIPMMESHYEKARLMLAAMDFGDIDVICIGIDIITQDYISAGVLTSFDKYLPDMPNFRSYQADTIPYWRNYDTENGELYFWQNGPDYNNLTAEPLDMVTRVDALEACGWPDLDTTDDYVAFLEEALEKLPETEGRPTLGMSAFFGHGGLMILASYLPRHSGLQHFYKFTGLVDPDTQSIVTLVDHPYLKESLRFWNTLYQKGLLDREAFTDEMGDLERKLNAGACIVGFFVKWMTGGANNNLTAEGREDQHYIVTPIRLQIAKDEGRNVRYELYNMARGDDTRGILTTFDDPWRILEIVDYVSSEEYLIRHYWGKEGQDYTINSDGRRIPTSDFMALMKSGTDEDIAIRKNRGIGAFDFLPMRQVGITSNGQASAVWNAVEYIMEGASPTQWKAYNAYGWKTPLDAWENNKNFDYIPFDITDYLTASIFDAESEEAKIEERITDYCTRQFPIVMNSNSDAEFEANYQELVDTCIQMDNQRVVDKYNEQLAGINERLDELRRK